MQVLHIDTGREMRGGQHQVLLLMKCLREKGHLSILLARRGSPLWRAADSNGFEVRPAAAGEIWTRSSGVDIVHAHDARAHSLVAALSRSKFVVSRRVAFPVKRSIWSRWKYARATRYLAVSGYVKEQLEKAGVAETKIDVVYDGVEPHPPVETWSAEFPLVALDSDDPGKMKELVAEAAALAGTPVVFSTNLVESFQRCSAFLYMSNSEGLGSAALLAMSVGTPVIASRQAGLQEVFADGVSGLYVNNDPTEIAGVIRKLLGSPTLARQLRDGGMARVAERFTAEHLALGTVAAYERALGG